MKSAKRLTAPLTLLLCGSIVSGCGGSTVRVQPSFPPLAELRVQPKPVAGPEIVTSAVASAEYSARIEAWGEAGWLQIARICRWARDLGAEGVECPE